MWGEVVRRLVRLGGCLVGCAARDRRPRTRPAGHLPNRAATTPPPSPVMPARRAGRRPRRSNHAHAGSSRSPTLRQFSSAVWTRWVTAFRARGVGRRVGVVGRGRPVDEALAVQDRQHLLVLDRAKGSWRPSWASYCPERRRVPAPVDRGSRQYEGRYLCSARTMYRLHAQHPEIRERRRQTTHPNYKRPELLATAPNQTWSWDVTLLNGPTRGTYYYLFFLLEIFSRYIVGWTLAHAQTGQIPRA